MQPNSTYIDEFENYKKLGFDPLPIPYENGRPCKVPKRAGWQTLAENREYVDADFRCDCNIGILLGGEKHLTDIDLDSPEAVAVGREILADLMKNIEVTL